MVDATDELRETHISLVVLFGDRVHKLKKPVRRARRPRSSASSAT